MLKKKTISQGIISQKSIPNKPRILTVKTGEMFFSSDQLDVLNIVALGSCTALAVWDTVKKIGGMYHILLPFPINSNQTPLPFYASVGLPLMFNTIYSKNSVKQDLNIAVIGGLDNTIYDNGKKTYYYVLESLKVNKYPVSFKYSGGNIPVSINLFISDGILRLSSINKAWTKDINLAQK